LMLFQVKKKPVWNIVTKQDCVLQIHSTQRELFPAILNAGNLLVGSRQILCPKLLAALKCDAELPLRFLSLSRVSPWVWQRGQGLTRLAVSWHTCHYLILPSNLQQLTHLTILSVEMIGSRDRVSSCGIGWLRVLTIECFFFIKKTWKLKTYKHKSGMWAKLR